MLSLPRQVWGNIVLFLASARACRQVLRQRLGRESLKWDKTTHAFPSTEQLRTYRKRLGELLIDCINATTLELSIPPDKKAPKGTSETRRFETHSDKSDSNSSMISLSEASRDLLLELQSASAALQ